MAYWTSHGASHRHAVDGAAAGMATGARAIDPTIWRVVGTPLIATTRLGPLSGMGVAVKDLYAVAGQRVGAGNPGL